MVTSLYNIPSRYLGSYIIKYSIVSEITITHLQIILHAVVISILVLQPCPYLFHHFPELHQKSEHFWTFLLSSPSSNPFELNSNEFEFKSFNHGLSIFLGTSIFLRVRESYPHALILVHSFRFSPLLSFLFCVWKSCEERGRREPSNPTGHLGPPNPPKP